MSYATLIVTVALVWLATGLVLAVVMGRRGHDPFAWLVIGAVFGPVAIPLAVDACLHGEDSRVQILSHMWSRGAGPVDVLAGIDGSRECRAALDAAVELLGVRIGRLTLATVVPYDGGTENEDSARVTLEAAAILLERPHRQEILRGRPAPALLRQAMLDGYDLLVIGAKGAGAAETVLGSTAMELARTAQVPVLMMGAGQKGPDRGSGAPSLTAQDVGL